MYMMVSYEYYVDRGGQLSEDDFSYFKAKAMDYIAYATMDKSNGELNQYQKKKAWDTICDLIDWFYNDDKIGKIAGNISSETVGAHSISYQKKTTQEKEKEKMQIVRVNLSMTGLLYKGLI